MKHNSDPTVDSPGQLEALESCGGVSLAPRRVLDTKFIRLGFATAEPSLKELS